jgi:hypothetical protein
VQLTSLAEVRVFVDRLAAAGDVRNDGPWSAAQVLVHCAQSIECSMNGYPVKKPWIFRATVGRIAKGVFLRRGHMKHDLGAPIPGIPEPDGESFARACERLQIAIDEFAAFEGTLAPHLAYGETDKPEYDRLHAMHVADHARALTVDGRPAAADGRAPAEGAAGAEREVGAPTP